MFKHKIVFTLLCKLNIYIIGANVIFSQLIGLIGIARDVIKIYII